MKPLFLDLSAKPGPGGVKTADDIIAENSRLRDLPSFISPEQILLALRQLRPSLYREIAVFANDYLFLLLKANYCQPQTTPVKGEP